MSYKVDLKGFMSDCEANYFRLRKLLPGFDEQDQFELGLPGAHQPILVLLIVERTPYTSLVSISQHETFTFSDWVPAPSLKVRLYHDARLAEVVNWSGSQNPRPKYAYPNDNMHQPDEKAQWNRFLSEWLALAIRHGFAATVPSVSVE